jgi:DNA-binding MarR family transcriptional regulator
MIARSIFQDMPPHRIGIAQSRAARNVAEFREAVLRDHGLTSPEWFVLGYVADTTAKGGIKVGDIATVLDVQSTYVTGILRKLEAKELIRWQADTGDRRVRIITVTKKGAAVTTAAEKELIKQSDPWLGRASDAAIRSYLSVLELLAQGPDKI